MYYTIISQIITHGYPSVDFDVLAHLPSNGQISCVKIEIGGVNTVLF